MTESLQSAVAGILAVLSAFSWLARDPVGNDRDVTECHDLVLQALSDADRVRTIECVTERNLRDQLTVADAIELQREIELRRCERRN